MRTEKCQEAKSTAPLQAANEEKQRESGSCLSDGGLANPANQFLITGLALRPSVYLEPGSICLSDGGLANPFQPSVYFDQSICTPTDIFTDSVIDSVVEISSDANIETGSGANIETGFDANIKTGSDANSETGFDANNETGSGANIETGSDANIKTGSDANSETGFDANNETGFGANIETGFDANIKTGSDANSETGFDANNETGSGANIETGFDANIKTGSDANSETGFDANNETGSGANIETGFDANIKTGSDANSETAFDANNENTFGANIETGSDANIKTGSDANSETGFDANNETGSGANIETGFDANIKTGSDANSETGFDANNETGSGANIETGFDANIKTGSDANSETGFDANNETANSGANIETGSDANIKTGSDANSEIGFDASNESGSGANTEIGSDANIKTFFSDLCANDCLKIQKDFDDGFVDAFSNLIAERHPGLKERHFENKADCNAKSVTGIHCRNNKELSDKEIVIIPDTNIEVTDSHSEVASTPSSVLWNAKHIVHGSFNQNNMRFSEQSRGFQCTCNALCMLAHSSCHEIDNSSVLDDILLHGDTLYKTTINSLKAQGKFVNSLLSLEEIPDIFDVEIGQFIVEKQPIVSGILVDTSEDHGLPSLHCALQSVFTRASFGLLIIGAICSAISKNNDLYVFFDSHSHGQNGLSSCDGTSVLISFSCIEDLVAYLYALYDSMAINMSLQFDLLAHL